MSKLFSPPLFLREALQGLARYPLRTGLTLLGLVIGVASVVGTLTLLAASKRLGLENLARFGALDVVRLKSPEGLFTQGRWVPVSKRVALGAGDLARLRAQLPELRASALHISQSLPVRHGAVKVDAQIDGGGINAAAFAPFTLEAGRFFKHEDIESAARVVVLSTGLATDLFDRAPAVGEEILIGTQRFTVIGVIRLPTDQNGEEPRLGHILYRAAIERLGAEPVDTELLLAAPSVERVGEVRRAVESLLPHLRPGIGPDSYEVETNEESIEGIVAEARMQGLILGGVALLAMLAAGGGILNTLLVGVKERTKEIGTRRAIGAKRGTILRQFFAEAVVLALPGAVIGLGAGVLVAQRLGAILASGLDDPTILVIAIGRRESIAAALAAVGVAALAGLWPAWQAACIPPAEALRYE